MSIPTSARTSRLGSERAIAEEIRARIRQRPDSRFRGGEHCSSIAKLASDTTRGPQMVITPSAGRRSSHPAVKRSTGRAGYRGENERLGSRRGRSGGLVAAELEAIRELGRLGTGGSPAASAARG